MGFRSSQNPTDTGLGFGRRLSDAKLNARQRYAAPYRPEPGNPLDGVKGDIPYWYNTHSMPGRKYSVPTAQKNRMVAREAIRHHADLGGANRPDPITDEEVDYLMTAKDQVESAKFDYWFSTKYDPLRPGGFPEIMNLNPDFVESRVQQSATDYEFAMRKEMIDEWGPQSMDDLMLMYMLDQGIIEGPDLVRRRAKVPYTAGVLSPYAWSEKTGAKMRLPGAASSIRGAKSPEEFVYPGDSPLMKDSGLDQIAATMYKQGGVPPNEDPGRPGTLAYKANNPGGARDGFVAAS